MRTNYSFILLHVAFQFSKHHLLKRLSLLQCLFLASLSKIIFPYTCGFICGLSLLFHWSVCLFSCNTIAVLIIVALLYNLKSRSVVLLVSFVFLRIALATQGLLWFHTNAMISLFCFFKKWHWDFDEYDITSVYCFG